MVLNQGVGNVGLGTGTSPNQKLQVNGSINVSGTSGTIYMQNIPGTGNALCINATGDWKVYRNTTCP